MDQKYYVERLRPSSRGIDHDECEYFVLDPLHDKAAFGALVHYANSEYIRDFQPELSASMLKWLSEIMERKIALDAEGEPYLKGYIKKDQPQSKEINPFLPPAPADGKHNFGENVGYRCLFCGVYNRSDVETEKAKMDAPCEGNFVNSGKMKAWAEDRFKAYKEDLVKERTS